jgi:hypothetical protein
MRARVKVRYDEIANTTPGLILKELRYPAHLKVSEDFVRRCGKQRRNKVCVVES